MASLNKVMIIGTLGNDPDVKQLQNGSTLCNMSVATNETYVDRDGVKQQSTEWHKVTCWGKTAELASSYLHKGSQVYVEGSLASRKYTDKQGIERYTTEIKAIRVQFLDKTERQQDARPQRQAYDENDGISF